MLRAELSTSESDTQSEADAAPTIDRTAPRHTEWLVRGPT